MIRALLVFLLLGLSFCTPPAEPAEENKTVKVQQKPPSAGDVTEAPGEILDEEEAPEETQEEEEEEEEEVVPTPQPKPQPTPGDPHANAEGLGSDCAACGASQMCLTVSNEQYCSRYCTQAQPCPAYWECVPLSSGGKYACIKSDNFPIDNPTPPVAAEAVITNEDPKNGQSCASQACGAGYGCITSGGSKTCAKSCKRDTECPAARVCDHFNYDVSYCWPGADPSTSYVEERDCTSGCDTIEAFWPPKNGDGYLVTHSPEYSYLRRDVIMFVRYAARQVEDFMPSPHGDLALMDMVQSDGNVPGADKCGCTRADETCSESCNQLRHPYGSHMDGLDLDIAYYQNAQNTGRSVCANDGQFCTSTPNMDYRRTAYFMARLYETGRIRVIGVDTAMEPGIRAAADTLLSEGWISQGVRDRFDTMMAYGSGWPFHFHHLHASFARPAASGPSRDEMPAWRPTMSCGFDLEKHGSGFIR